MKNISKLKSNLFRIYCVLFRSKIIYLLLFIAVCVVYILAFLYLLLKSTTENINIINNFKIMSDIILSLVSVLGIIFTIVYAYRQYESEKKHRRISKAADLAKLYADELLDPIGTIINEFSKIEKSDAPVFSHFKDIFEKVDLDNVSKFNENELKSKLNDDDILFYKLVVVKKVKIDENDEQVTLNKIICTTLNKMEYFCIYFNSNIAEDMTVYQSLHQSFFEVVKYTYIYICLNNMDVLDKYYTNVIITYVRWRNIYLKNKEEIEVEREKLMHANEKYNEKISTKIKIPNI